MLSYVWKETAINTSLSPLTIVVAWMASPLMENWTFPNGKGRCPKKFYSLSLIWGVEKSPWELVTRAPSCSLGVHINNIFMV